MIVPSDPSEAGPTATPGAPAPTGDAPTPEPSGDPTITPTEAPGTARLVWAEVDLADALGANKRSTIRLESVGDGRVLALNVVDRGIDTILVTENGKEWSPIPLPARFLPWSVDITGDRWLLQGLDTFDGGPGAQTLFSDDGGASWIELLIDLDPLAGTVWIANAFVAGKLIVVVAQSDDIDQALDEDMAYEPSDERVHLFLSDGGPAELVAEFPGWASGGYGASDGFHLIISGPDGDQLLTSPDGREWTRTTVDVEVTDSAQNEIWTADEGHTEYRTERFEGVYGSGQVLTLPDGIGWMPDLAVGPAGVAAVGGPEAGPAVNSDYDPNKFLIGWSVDGTNWEWQTLQEAFGLPETTQDDNSFTEVQVAVGQDFVLAKVQTFVFPEAELDESAEIGVGNGETSAFHTGSKISASPHRWFIARAD